MSTTRRIRFPSRLLILLFLVALTTGCQTTVGNYFGNRGRDFGETLVFEVGVGPALGADLKAIGVLHFSAITTARFMHWTVGWNYGELRPKQRGREDIYGLEGDLGFPLGLLLFDDGVLHLNQESREAPSRDHGCFFVLPALFSWSKRPLTCESWLWGDDAQTWDQIHAFDVEVTLAAGLSIRAGFSPGEFVDFLLGWFGVDIAGDDRPLSSEEVPTPDSDESEREVP